MGERVGQALFKRCGLERDISSCMATEGQPALTVTLASRRYDEVWASTCIVAIWAKHQFEHYMDEYCLHKR